ncbi:hypothetical protein BGZ89_005456 [Linnemannia elongata]|nr:hypothetical protein BGZ89_005456 [Linnemannia elongata]
MALTIRVGPSRQQESLKPCSINRDSEPVYISSEHFEGLITVRIQHHHPATLSSSSPINKSASTCAYFENHSRVFSLQWQGRFKATNPWSKDGLWDADEVLFVAEVEGKIHVPMGTSIATAFARTIDPSFIADGIWDPKRPWVGSPLVSGMNVLRVWKAPLLPTSDSAPSTTATAITISRGTGSGSGDCCSTENQDRGGDGNEEGRENGVGPWIYHGVHRLEEGHVDLLSEAGARRQQLQVSSTVGTASMDSITTPPSKATTATGQQKLQGLTSYQRRRYFTKTEHRQAAVLAPDLVIAGDFFNNFTNFETRRVSMGISIRMDRVLQDDQPLRFVCKSRRRHLEKQKQEYGHGQRQRGWPIKRRNRKGRNKHEVRSTTLAGGGRSGRRGGEVEQEGEEMDIVIEDSDRDDDVGVDGGEGDEQQEEMDDRYDDKEGEEEEEIVFFVVELRWDQPSIMVL